MSSGAPNEFAVLAAGDADGWTASGGQYKRKKYRLNAASAMAARLDDRIPKAYEQYPGLGLYASAIEAVYLDRSRNLFEVNVTWTQRSTGAVTPTNPQPGDEYWSFGSGAENARVHYALKPPIELFADDNLREDLGNRIGFNPQTGERNGVDVPDTAMTLQVTQYRRRTETRQDFAYWVAASRRTVNQNVFYGFPPRCLYLAAVNVPEATTTVIPVQFTFSVKAPFDLAQMELVRSDGSSPGLFGTMAGYDFLDLVMGEKPVKSSPTAEHADATLHYCRAARVCQTCYTSTFEEFGLSGVLA